MKVVVAYCDLHPMTEWAVLASVDELDDVVWADTSSSDSAYYELIRENWLEGETFVLLEQDKVPDQGALRELYDCPEPWCTYPVPMAHNGEPCGFVSLSCTKFSADLIRKLPDLMDQVGEIDLGYGPKHWGRLDMAMASRINRKVMPHWHDAGRIAHHHSAGVSA